MKVQAGRLKLNDKVVGLLIPEDKANTLVTTLLKLINGDKEYDIEELGIISITIAELSKVLNR